MARTPGSHPGNRGSIPRRVTNIMNIKKYKRINIIGTSGCGKTTMAKKLAKLLNYEYIEMDRIFWGPNWQESDYDSFFKKLGKELKKEKWVLDGNYTKSIPLKWKYTDLVIWLDYSFLRNFFQSFTRAIKRLITREVLWSSSGNKETLKSFFSKESIVLHMVKKYRVHQKRYNLYIKDNNFSHIKFIKLKNPKQVKGFLNNLK